MYFNVFQCISIGTIQLLELLLPHATQKSLDRAMIAATARSHHHVVEYMLSQRGNQEEKEEKEGTEGTDTSSGGGGGGGAT